MTEYLPENSNLSQIKSEYPNKLIVLIIDSNLNLAEKEKYNLLSFMARKRKTKEDILIEIELNVTQGCILIFKKNQGYEELIKEYQSNQRYYLQSEGKSIQDKVKIV